MRKLKKLIDTMTVGMEENLKLALVPESYKGRERKVVGLIKDFQELIKSQLFSMQVVESQIEVSSNEIANVLNQQKNSSEAMLESSKSLSKANEIGVATTANTIEAVWEIHQGIQVLEGSTEGLTSTTLEAKETVNNQIHEVYGIIDSIKSVEEMTQGSVETINTLENAIDDIGEILKMVQKFYSQTKLLALNATIESARAGEAGKGFAVVAQEISGLAEDSAGAVQEIVDIMKTINSSINQVKLNANKESEAIEEASVSANGVSSGLTKITNAFENIEESLGVMNNHMAHTMDIALKAEKTLEEAKDASSAVEGEVVKLMEHIEIQHKHSEKLMGIEGIMKDIGLSLNAASCNLNLDLYIEAKEKIQENSKELIANLKPLAETDLIGEKAWKSDNGNIQVHREILDKVLLNDETIEAIWTNTSKGNFVYSNPPAGIANADIRPWFHEAMKGKNYVSDIYISGISKAPCITISMPLQKNSQVIGVLGMDVRIS